MTYVMHDFDLGNFDHFKKIYYFLGYVQGMSDFLSPILVLMENEVDAFWCFVGLMDRVVEIFRLHKM